MDNIFYYSSMSSKDISLKTEQYLNGGNHEHTGASRNAIAFPQHSFEPIREDVPSTYSNAPTYLPPTPRISYEINEIPQENLLFKEVSVKVGDIINPANFYLVLQDKAIQYDALKVDLKRFYESNCFPLPIQLDRYYATKMEGTNEWNRVQVLSHVGKFCNCFFIDEGKTFYVPEERLFLLDDLFKALPPRSFKSGLLGLTSPIWNVSVTNHFKILVLGKTLLAFVQTCEKNICKCILANGVNVNEEVSKLIY